MFSKALATYLRLRHWQQRRKGYGLLHEVGTKITFRSVNGHLFIRKGKDPIKPVDVPVNTKRAYNTQTKEWEG
jgi:hypothetical protein